MGAATAFVQLGFAGLHQEDDRLDMMEGWRNPEEDKRLYRLGWTRAMNDSGGRSSKARKMLNEVCAYVDHYSSGEHVVLQMQQVERDDHYGRGYLDGLLKLSGV